MAELLVLSEPRLAAELAVLEADVVAYPWQVLLYEQALLSQAECVQVWQAEGTWLAVAISEVVIDELHIHNFFVPRTYQRQGHAKALLQAILRQAQDGCIRALLEVRAGNSAAIALYLAVGFVECGRRKGYYRHEAGREDAILMECLF